GLPTPRRHILRRGPHADAGPLALPRRERASAGGLRPSSDRAATGTRPRRRRPERARAAPGAPAGGAAAGATAERDQPPSRRRGGGLTALGWSGTGAPVRRLA